MPFGFGPNSTALANARRDFQSPLDTPVDYAELGGDRTPGIAEISGLDDARKWDVRRGYGLDGAALFYCGHDPAHFALRLKLYTRADWEAWRAFRTRIKRPKRVPTPEGFRTLDTGCLTIWHPFLADFLITVVVVESVSQPELTDETGEWTITLKLIEYRAPRPQMAAPKGAAATKAPPTENEQRILKNTARIKELREQLAKP